MSQVVKILEAYYVTHDVKRFVVEKPAGFHFVPGQAVDVSINLPEWQAQLRPFTFTGLDEDKALEFMIKIYNDRDGVTKKLGGINAGGELILHEVFGTIQYKGPGVFIAAGAGITPFISIIRNLYKNQQLRGNRLIYSNKTSDDVIMYDELRRMLKNDFINVFTREHIIGFTGKRIDRNFLIEYIANFGQHFYVCGPDEFVRDITTHLIELGAVAETVVFEK